MNAITRYMVANVVNFRRLAGQFVGGDIKALLGPYSDLGTALVSLGLVFRFVNFLCRRKVFLRL